MASDSEEDKSQLSNDLQQFYEDKKAFLAVNRTIKSKKKRKNKKLTDEIQEMTYEAPKKPPISHNIHVIGRIMQ